jgi:alanyl-tRNA synthetase
MTSNEIRSKFLEYFKQKGHTIVPSSSLIPDDPSVLLTTAGMQQFKPYYSELDPTTAVHPSLGKPIGKNACSVQKCFRTSDIDEVGDVSHLTMFEMLGNFSFGGYFKKEAIEFAHEFITNVMGLPISYVTVFKGSDLVPKDADSKKIWQSLGVKDIREEGMEDVFWGPTGSGGPCGPCTELYVKTPEGKDVEVWNLVFNEFICPSSREDLLAGKSKLEKLARPGVDTGMGFERLVIMVQKVKSIYDTDLFQSLFGKILSNENQKSARIVCDHLRSTVFLLADGITPSNKDRGYVLRRVTRRLIVHAMRIGMQREVLKNEYLDAVINAYADTYPELKTNRQTVHDEFEKESAKFANTFEKGLAEFKKRFPQTAEKKTVGSEAFDLYQSFGLTPDVLRDLLSEAGYAFDEPSFEKEFKKHQAISKAGAEGKFGGHGLDQAGAMSEDDAKKMTRLHTATHLLHKALRIVLGDQVEQQGSDITPERLRFDFSYPQKLSPEQLLAVQKIVNDEILNDLPVIVQEMPFKQAVAEGALAFFKNKYPETVKVYSMQGFSKEVCGGPHVTHTAEVGRVKIVKEEAVSAGVRRIRAVLEQ